MGRAAHLGERVELGQQRLEDHRKATLRVLEQGRGSLPEDLIRLEWSRDSCRVRRELDGSQRSIETRSALWHPARHLQRPGGRDGPFRRCA